MAKQEININNIDASTHSYTLRVLEDAGMLLLEKKEYIETITYLAHKKKVQREIDIIDSLIHYLFCYIEENSMLWKRLEEKDSYYNNLHNAIKSIYEHNKQSNLFYNLLYKPQSIISLFERREKEISNLERFKNWFKTAKNKEKLIDEYFETLQIHEETINALTITL